MDPTHEERTKRIAQRQMWAGWGTAAAMLAARLTTVVWQLSSGSLDLARFGLAIFKSAVLVAVVLLYPRYRWPAYLMLSVWPIGFVSAWVPAHAPPRVLAVGVLVGIGFLLGARGVRTLHRLRALEQSSTVSG